MTEYPDSGSTLTYKFWSIYLEKRYTGDRVWLCIPPHEDYIPEWYPSNALVKKHEEKILPPPSCWLLPEYEGMVYEKDFITAGKKTT